MLIFVFGFDGSRVENDDGCFTSTSLVSFVSVDSLYLIVQKDASVQHQAGVTSHITHIKQIQSVQSQCFNCAGHAIATSLTTRQASGVSYDTI